MNLMGTGDLCEEPSSTWNALSIIQPTLLKQNNYLCPKKHISYLQLLNEETGRGCPISKWGIVKFECDYAATIGFGIFAVLGCN